MPIRSMSASLVLTSVNPALNWADFSRVTTLDSCTLEVGPRTRRVTGLEFRSQGFGLFDQDVGMCVNHRLSHEGSFLT